MDWYVYVGLATALIVAFVIVCFLVVRRAKRTPEIDIELVYEALGRDNLKAVTLRRNKINATLDNHKNADLITLKKAGAAGVNVVGNTAKFYFDADTDDVYEGLKRKIDKRG